MTTIGMKLDNTALYRMHGMELPAKACMYFIHHILSTEWSMIKGHHLRIVHCGYYNNCPSVCKMVQKEELLKSVISKLPGTWWTSCFESWAYCLRHLKIHNTPGKTFTKGQKSACWKKKKRAKFLVNQTCCEQPIATYASLPPSNTAKFILFVCLCFIRFENKYSRFESPVTFSKIYLKPSWQPLVAAFRKYLWLWIQTASVNRILIWIILKKNCWYHKKLKFYDAYNSIKTPSRSQVSCKTDFQWSASRTRRLAFAFDGHIALRCSKGPYHVRQHNTK